MKRRLMEMTAAVAATSTILTGCSSGNNSEVRGEHWMPSPQDRGGTSASEAENIANPLMDAIRSDWEQASPDQPREWARRCVFAAGQKAVLEVLRTPGVEKSEIKSGLVQYEVPAQDAESDQLRAFVDTRTSGEYNLSFYVRYSDSNILLNGAATVPEKGSAEESIEAVNPLKVHKQYEIDDTSTITETGYSGTGVARGGAINEAIVAEEANNPADAAAICGVAEDFLEEWWFRAAAGYRQ